jgi:hypothetical protein
MNIGEQICKWLNFEMDGEDFAGSKLYRLQGQIFQNKPLHSKKLTISNIYQQD